MKNQNFSKLISLIQSHPRFNEQLLIIQKDFAVKIYKITELDLNSIVHLYSIMEKKFYLNRKVSNEESWYQNQLRIFVWLLFGYLYVFHKDIEALNQDDWNFFSPIFNYKRTIFFQFQSRSLQKALGKPTFWSAQQTQLLSTIINEKKSKNQWNSIARELFIRSGKLFFRNPKQCRERWINHLDPKKIHSEWTADQDLILLTCIKKKGKKWSSAVKELSNTRTEHMVKNRYKSLMLNKIKEYPGKREFQIENILIKNLEKIIEKQSKAVKKVQLKVEEMIEPEYRPEVKRMNFELKEEFQEGVEEEAEPIEYEDKKDMKEEKIKCQEDPAIYNFSRNMFNDFNQFGNNSPFFIPWQNTNENYLFDLQEDKSLDYYGYSRGIKLYDLQELEM